MGPIQSGMNQIIQNIMHGATMYAGGRAIRGVREEVKTGNQASSAAIKGVREEVKTGTEAASKALEGVKTEVGKGTKATSEAISGVKKELKAISDYRDKLSKTKTPEERLKVQEEAPNVSQKAIDKYNKKNPNDNEFLNVAIKTDAETAQQISDIDAEIADIMSNLPTYTPVSNESIGNEKAAERVTDMIRQRSLFEGNKKAIENPVNFTKGYQLPSSINRKIKNTARENLPKRLGGKK